MCITRSAIQGNFFVPNFLSLINYIRRGINEKKTLAGLAIIFFVFGVAAMASATPLTITNGSFESGNLTGWSTQVDSYDGSVSVVTNANGYTATDGTYFANLTATSLLFQNASWEAGDVFSFDWNFGAKDYLPYNDYSIFEIEGAGATLFSLTLADVASVGYNASTGWNTYTYTFAAAGSGSFGFGVNNDIDSGFDSQLFIDNVRSDNAPVPEPSTMLLLCTGLMGLVFVRRKFKEN